MKRLYYVTSRIDSAEQIANDLHKEGISDWHFRVLSKDHIGLHQHHIHSTNYLQEFDVVHSGLRGTIVGVVVGLTLCLTVNKLAGYPALSLQLLILIGALFGTWLGALIGLSHENYKVARFHNEIEDGKYLIMVDVRKNEEDKIKEVMERYHPEALKSGEDTTLINPFKGHMGVIRHS